MGDLCGLLCQEGVLEPCRGAPTAGGVEQARGRAAGLGEGEVEVRSEGEGRAFH